MFVGDEMRLDMSFAIARDRLAGLAAGTALVSTSQEAYDQESSSLVRAGAEGLSRLVRVQVRELAWSGGSAGMAIRWEATGTAGVLFPVLDADIRLAPAGAQAAVLTMAGSYRPPLGILGQAIDRAILHRIAVATLHNFLSQLAEQIARG